LLNFPTGPLAHRILIGGRYTYDFNRSNTYALRALGTTPEQTAAHAQRTFANLRHLRDDLAARCGTPLRELSMGMTGDLALAVAAGSTLVRVGTALYGAR
jgi:uncharacterized pyridoxal phosphate-containing UPF0001 family protein